MAMSASSAEELKEIVQQKAEGVANNDWVQTQQGYQFCPRYGNKLPVSSVFCNNCRAFAKTASLTPEVCRFLGSIINVGVRQ